ncbi:mitochondrial ribosomal subunit protein-domain-containing protein [Tirmania nivea]|nr:mitochondrial ribosomal subunit protein-domain-containing protein [Tirmania nivea]
MASKSLTQVLFRCKPLVIFGRPVARPMLRPFSSAPQSLAQPSSSFDPLGAIEEKPWEFDDISSAGHAELDQHREAREYARIAAYEMPLLAQYAQPFKLPTQEQILRFRYTTYMGEKHPSESKVVMEFTTKDLGLEPISRRKLIKLAGARYNPEKDLVYMSCEIFETQAQNKRYLSDLLDKLLAEAKDLTDDFEDIPLDFRHFEKKFTVKPKFPVEWRMTKRRREALKEMRMQHMGAR